MDLDRFGQMQPEGPPSWYRRRSEVLARTCPFSPSAANEDEIAAEVFPDAPRTHWAVGRFRSSYVGHVAEEGYRMQGSSGGMVSWVLAELLRRGLVDAVVHVSPADPESENRFFQYHISKSVDEICAGAKSRYYPVEMSEALRTIRRTPGRVAIVGVPCFIKAVQLLRREDAVLRERVAFTLGIFCGHMKSARMVESFAWQMGAPVDQIRAVEFRLKDPSRPASTYTAQLTLNGGSVTRRDWWNLIDGDWGSGFFQYSACNFCDDVVAETADISFGDAWVEPYSSDGRGTNVVVVRSAVMEELIEDGIRDGRLELKPVDGDFVQETQAAGFRQRREGLAYRLTWPRIGKIRPVKRVTPEDATLTLKRKLVYRSRAHISAWSHRLFWLARRMDRPQLFLGWARAAVAFYHAVTYSRGKFGEWLVRIGLK
jgi:coenzyme F420-reducing hydrogenase beta subunit